MKYKLILLCFASAITMWACETPAISKVKTDNVSFDVEYLFQKDGVRVYRFRDGGYIHYFTTDGEAIYTQHRQGGKTIYTYEENIKRENRDTINLQ